MSLRILLCALLLLALALPSPVHAFFGSSPETFDTLAEMTDAMAKEMKTNHAGRKLYLDKEDVRDDQDGAICPFSGMLVNELERALSRVGFAFEGRYIDQADFAVSISYHRTTDKVTVYVKLKELKSNSAYRNLSGNYEMLLNKLPADCFIENLDSRLARLATKLSRGWHRANELSVFITPVVEVRKKYSSPFSEYVTRKLKIILPNENVIKIIEEKPAMQKMAATRSVNKDAVTIETSEASIVGADAVLEGTYLLGSQSVSLAASLKNLKGSILASAEENIPIPLIQFSLENDTAETLAQIADTEHEKTGGAVRIGTIKGGAYQVFREGETVRFTLQVSRPLYVYVYDINPNGEVALLFPKAGEAETPKQPGIIYTLPEESDSWEIKVEPPFGKDAVKVFASDRKLPIPRISEKVASRSFVDGTRSLTRTDKVRNELASQSSINGLDLVDYYKGIAAKAKAPLFESTVYVETRGN